jgi:CRP/FNR family transcriptional regulator, anaerobic regulatory protein
MKTSLAPEADQFANVIGRHRRADATCGVDPCGFCEARPFSVCKAVPEADLALLADASTVVNLGKGEVLVREDDPADSLFNVTTGALKSTSSCPTDAGRF